MKKKKKKKGNGKKITMKMETDYKNSL